MSRLRNSVRSSLAFTSVVLRLFLRDPMSLFFLLALPAAIIVIIGTTFGGAAQVRLGVVAAADDPVATRIVGALDAADGVEIERYDSREALDKALRRSNLIAAGVVVGPDAARSVAAGDSAPVAFVTLVANDSGVIARRAVTGVLERLNGELAAAQFAARRTGARFDETAPAAASIAASGVASATRVDVRDVGSARAADRSQFSSVVPQNLVLFVFINCLAGAAFLVASKRAGVLRRALSSPVPEWRVLAGIGLGWFALAIVQTAIIMGLGALVFGVDFGNPLGAAALALVFALVGCGAGMLVGAYGKSDDRVGAVMPIVGIVAGALGGCMVPLEVFPSFMRTIAHATPHFWAVDAWQRLIFDGEGIGAIAPNLIVLAVVAVVAVALASRKLRRELTA